MHDSIVVSSELLPLLGAVEKELSLLDGIIQDIYIYEAENNEMVVNFKFKISEDYPNAIIGGLLATINEYAGRNTNRKTRTVVMKEVKLLFTNLEKFMIVIVVDPSYNDEQFANIMTILFDTYLECTESFNSELAFVDELAIDSQFVFNFLSEEVEVQLLNGKVVSLYPYKLREMAESRASSVLSIPELEMGDDLSQGAELSSPTTRDFQPKDENQKSKSDALTQLLNKFIRTFSDALEVTILRVAHDGTVYKTTASRLEEEIGQNVYEVITSSIDEIFEIMEKSEEERMVDLDDKWVFFEKINPKCFVYLTVENKNVLALIRPLITRITSVISMLFPEDSF